MRNLIILTIALVACLIIQAKAEEITVKGRLISQGLIHHYTKVKVDRGNTVRDLGARICEKLEGVTPNKVKVKGHLDFMGWYDTDKSVDREGIKHGDKVKVDCHP